MTVAKLRAIPQGQVRTQIWTWLAMGAPLVLLLVLFLIYPVGQLLLLSIHNDSGFTLAQYRQLFASSVYVDVLLITLKISFVTTLVCIVTGYPIAYLISMVGKERKATLLFWVLLSFWTSFLVRAFAWIVLLGRNGVINKLLLSLGIISSPANLLYNFGSVLVGMVNALLPLAVLTMLSVMDNIDRNLPRAAATLGAGPGTAFWKVYFPLSLPGVAAAGIMVFVTAIGFFIVPALLGGRRETMITQLIIDQIQQTMNWGFAGAIAVLLLVVVLIVFVAYDRLLGLSTMTGAATTRSAAPSRLSGPIQKIGDAILTLLGTISDRIILLLPSRRRGRNPDRPGPGLQVFVWTMLVIISAPTLLMIPLSFGSGGLNWPPQGFTLHWYETVLHSPVWTQAFLRSLMVGLGTGALAMLIGTPAAFLLVRSDIPGKAAWLALILSPIVVPRMIIAVGLFYVFASMGLVGSAFGLILGHTVVAVPYVVMTMMAVLRNYDTRLDHAAQSLGARPFATLRHVTFPILGAGMMSSFLFAFATSFDELTIALFATGGLNATLPKQFWDEVTLQVSPVIAAVSTCLFIFMGILIFIAERMRRRKVVIPRFNQRSSLMLTATRLRGLFPAIPTPVKADDTIDTEAVSALFAWLLKQGIDGVVPLGGTGEYGALSRRERIRMAGLSAKTMAGKGPVIAGVLDTGFHDALQAGKEFAAEGADGLLVLTPYYTNPTQAGIRDYFLRYADASPVPLLIYEIPYRTRIAIEPKILHELSRHPNIIGMKACNLDMYHFLQVVSDVDDSFAVLSGEDSLFPLHLAAGAKGGIIVTACLLPRAWRQIFDAAVDGRTADALKLHRSLIPLMNMAFAETNPGPMKSVMDLVGVDAPRMLAPLVQPAPSLVAALRAELGRLLPISEGVA